MGRAVAARDLLAGQRFTRQRRLLLDIIRGGGGHLDADEIYRRARDHDPKLSLSTVYRNLSFFARLGLVEERHFDEAHHHYEVRTSSEHYHLRCLGCGKVREFESNLTEHIKEDAARHTGFRVTGGEFHLVGYCQDCTSAREAASKG